MNKGYEYSKGNRLIHPHNYMYTLYGGKKLLKDFFKLRDTCIKFLGHPDKEYELLSRLDTCLQKSIGLNLSLIHI